MGTDFSPKTPIKSLTPQQIVRMHQLFRQAKFDDPSGDVRCSLLFNLAAYFENYDNQNSRSTLIYVLNNYGI